MLRGLASLYILIMMPGSKWCQCGRGRVDRTGPKLFTWLMNLIKLSIHVFTCFRYCVQSACGTCFRPALVLAGLGPHRGSWSGRRRASNGFWPQGGTIGCRTLGSTGGRFWEV